MSEGVSMLFDVAVSFVIVLVGVIGIAPLVDYFAPDLPDRIKLGIVVVFCITCIIYYQYEANYYSEKMEKKP
jgi:hypothetical protein